MSTVMVPLGSGGDFPSFFPLPPPTPGAGPAANASATPPTHVHMVSGGCMSPGWCTPAARLLIPPPAPSDSGLRRGCPQFTVSPTARWYTPGPPKTLGEFILADPKTHRKSDQGQYYATKDFFDPVKNRRILWGWGVPLAVCETVILLAPSLHPH